MQNYSDTPAESNWTMKNEKENFDTKKIFLELANKFWEDDINKWLETTIDYSELSDYRKNPLMTSKDVKNIAILRIELNVAQTQEKLNQLKTEIKSTPIVESINNNIKTTSTSNDPVKKVPASSPKSQLTETINSNPMLQTKLEIDWILNKPSDGQIIPLKNMPWVWFMKYENQTTMNLSWGKIGAFTENKTQDFSNPKTWNYAWWHDVSSQSIADYFNSSKSQTTEEKTLLKTLQSQGIITETEWKFIWAPNQAVLVMFYNNNEKIEINGEDVSGNQAREQIKWWVNHELAHGMYFTNPEFKTVTDTIWKDLDWDTKTNISKALTKNYKNETFHPTEFLSYLLFTWDKITIESNIWILPNFEKLRTDAISKFNSSSSDIKKFVDNKETVK